MSNTFEHKYNKYKTKYNEIIGGVGYLGPRCSVDVLIVKKEESKYKFLVETKGPKGKEIKKLPGWVIFNEDDSDLTKFTELILSKKIGFVDELAKVLSSQNAEDTNYKLLGSLKDLKLISVKEIESESSGKYNKGHLFYKYIEDKDQLKFENITKKNKKGDEITSTWSWENYNLECFAALPNQVKYIPDLHMSNMD